MSLRTGVRAGLITGVAAAAAATVSFAVAGVVTSGNYQPRVPGGTGYGYNCPGGGGFGYGYNNSPSPCPSNTATATATGTGTPGPTGTGTGTPGPTGTGTGTPRPTGTGTPRPTTQPPFGVISCNLSASAIFVNKGQRVTLTGKETRNGIGFANRSVTLKVNYSDGKVNVIQSTLTDASGNFRLTTIPLYNGSFSITCDGAVSNFVKSRVKVTYRKVTVRIDGLTITVRAETRPGFNTSPSRQERVQLLLVDNTGRQVAVLRITNANQRRFFPGEAQGTNEIVFSGVTLRPGTYNLVVKVIGTPVNTGAKSKVTRVTIR